MESVNVRQFNKVFIFFMHSLSKVGRGNVGLWSQSNNLYGVSGELRTTSASPIFRGHRMALGCSGLHANDCFNANRNCPLNKNLCSICPTLPYALCLHEYFYKQAGPTFCVREVVMIAKKLESKNDQALKRA